MEACIDFLFIVFLMNSPEIKMLYYGNETLFLEARDIVAVSVRARAMEVQKACLVYFKEEFNGFVPQETDKELATIYYRVAAIVLSKEG